VIQLASIVLFHLPSESDEIRPVKKNVQLLMNRLITTQGGVNSALRRAETHPSGQENNRPQNMPCA
jgi:hypothetical protein